MCVHLHTWRDMHVLEWGGECDGKTFHNFVYYIFDCWFITWIESSQYISVHVWYKQVPLDVKHSALHACMRYLHVQVIVLAKQETHHAVHRRFSSKKSTNVNAWLSPFDFCWLPYNRTPTFVHWLSLSLPISQSYIYTAQTHNYAHPYTQKVHMALKCCYSANCFLSWYWLLLIIPLCVATFVYVFRAWKPAKLS